MHTQAVKNRHNVLNTENGIQMLLIHGVKLTFKPTDIFSCIYTFELLCLAGIVI